MPWASTFAVGRRVRVDDRSITSVEIPARGDVEMAGRMKRMWEIAKARISELKDG